MPDLYGCGVPGTARARKPNSAPANSKSFIVIVPFGFSAVTRLSWISCVHSTCHIIGFRYLVPLHHTPPSPRRHASVYLIYVGAETTSCRTDVGFFYMHCIRHCQSSRHWCNVGVIDIKSGLSDMAISMGFNRLRPPGIPMEAC